MAENKKASLGAQAAAATKMTRKLQGLPEPAEDDDSEVATPRKEELKTYSLSGNLEQLMESDGEDVSPEEEKRRQEEEERAEELRRQRDAASRVSKRVTQKLRQQARGLKSRVLRQRLRSLKIREGLHLQIPRCGIKLLLVQEKMGHYAEYFVRAGYDVVDMYKKFTDAEIDFILNTVEKRNDFSFDPDDRVTLYKLFRYRYFLAPGIAKPLRKLEEIPRISLTKHSAKAPDDADIDMKELESDRKRMVKRVPMFDEQAGMRMVQLERYDREADLVYEIKDIQVCALEFEHLDPKTLLKRDPREEVLLRRMHRADRNILRRMDYTATRDTRRRKVLENLKYFRVVYFYLTILIFVLALLKNSDQGLGGMFGNVMLEAGFMGAFVMYMGFLFTYRVMFYFKEGLDTYKLRKMLFVVKRFRSRLLKFRDKTEKERLERFDNVLASIDEFFAQRSREQAEEEQRLRDEALLQKTLNEGLTFDTWFEQKSKMLSLGGLPYVAASNKESEKVLPPPPDEERMDYGDGDRDGKVMLKQQLYQNVTKGRLMPIQMIDNFPGGSTRGRGGRFNEIVDDERQRLLPRYGDLDASSSSYAPSTSGAPSQTGGSRAASASATRPGRGVIQISADGGSSSGQGRGQGLGASGSRGSSQTGGPAVTVMSPTSATGHSGAPFRDGEGGLGGSASVVSVDTQARMNALLGEENVVEQQMLQGYQDRGSSSGGGPAPTGTGGSGATARGSGSGPQAEQIGNPSGGGGLGEGGGLGMNNRQSGGSNPSSPDDV